MKQTKKKKKNSAEKISVSGLLENKPWKDFVEGLPEQMRRTGAYAMDAFEKGNVNRMEQFIKQMPFSGICQEEFALHICLYWLHVKNKSLEFSVKELEKLLEMAEACPEKGEEERALLAGRLAFLPVPFTEIIRSDREKRARKLRLSIASLYLELDREEEAAALFEQLRPFARDEADAYACYMDALMKLMRDKDSLALSDEILMVYADRLKDGSACPREEAVSITEACAAGVLVSLRKEQIDQKDIEEAERYAEKLAGFLPSLPEEVKSDLIFQKCLSGQIIELSGRGGRIGIYQKPIRWMLDGARKAQIFDPVHDPAGEYRFLLLSAYQGLEIYEMQKKKDAGVTLALLLQTVLMAKLEIQDPQEGEAGGRAAIATLEIHRWYLLRYQAESDQNREEVLKLFSSMPKDYPCCWEMLKEEEPLLTGDLAEGMKLMVSSVKKAARRKETEEEIGQEMEKGYQMSEDSIRNYPERCFR